MAFDLLFPYPEYDWQATERWLQKKAAKGHRLLPGGNLRGFAAFERSAPAAIRYRLIPREGRKLYHKPMDEPPATDALELYRVMGWEYLTNHGPFYIFASEDPDAPEPSTDPRVLAMALKPAAIYSVLETVAWLLFVRLQATRIGFLEAAVTRNDPFWLLLPVPLVLAIGGRMAACVRLIRSWLRCRRGEVPGPGRRLWMSDHMGLAACLMLALLCVHMGRQPAAAVPSETCDNYVRHEEAQWPFTIPGATVTESSAASFTTFATRENWSYDGELALTDGRREEIYIDCADFHSSLLARWYAWELRWQHPDDLILRRGTEVWRVNTDLPIDDPESVFLPERRE